MTIAAARGVGVITAGENHLVMVPKNYVPNGTRPGILFAHGYGAVETVALDRGGWPTQAALIAEIASHWPVLSCTYGGDQFGNDIAQARMTAAKTYLQGPLGAKAGKIGIIGISMGGGLMMAWARANPTLVSCMVGLIPLSDLNDVFVNNRTGTGTAGVNAAYGGAYDDNVQGPTHNPTKFASQLAGIPTQIWYATDDTVVIPSTVVPVGTAIGAEMHTLTGGHLDGSFAGIDTQVVLDFLSAHL